MFSRSASTTSSIELTRENVPRDVVRASLGLTSTSASRIHATSRRCRQKGTLDALLVARSLPVHPTHLVVPEVVTTVLALRLSRTMSLSSRVVGQRDAPPHTN